MKRIISILLILVMFLSVGVGCSKNNENGDFKNEEITNEEDIQETENKEDKDKESQEVEDIEYVLYLKNKSVPFIFAEKFTVKSNDPILNEKSFEEFVLDQLISYGEFQDLVSPIPEGTKILNVEKEDGTVFVDFSKEFIENMDNNKESTKISLAAITNTLTILEGNENVVFKVEGEKIDNLNGVNMNKEFIFNKEFFPSK
ncbi:GerMN domain-containing protein [Thermohalobacter berrensis]|uniref:GerMN domain-containing protein n=1 Tax=Thermohalobacter berrensis TaxID=99594 RepID=A0A419T4X7_9FIRM|nr:GerMN domain-containing protein [Thermohalobacter berrensis]RKD32541.1 hypothetical protein BET03_10710 [Thermohalobacter berrensis]